MKESGIDGGGHPVPLCQSHIALMLMQRVCLPIDVPTPSEESCRFRESHPWTNRVWVQSVSWHLEARFQF